MDRVLGEEGGRIFGRTEQGKEGRRDKGKQCSGARHSGERRSKARVRGNTAELGLVRGRELPGQSEERKEGQEETVQQNEAGEGKGAGQGKRKKGKQ